MWCISYAPSTPHPFLPEATTWAKRVTSRRQSSYSHRAHTLAQWGRTQMSSSEPSGQKEGPGGTGLSRESSCPVGETDEREDPGPSERTLVRLLPPLFDHRLSAESESADAALPCLAIPLGRHQSEELFSVGRIRVGQNHPGPRVGPLLDHHLFLCTAPTALHRPVKHARSKEVRLVK